MVLEGCKFNLRCLYLLKYRELETVLSGACPGVGVGHIRYVEEVSGVRGRQTTRNRVKWERVWS